MLAKKYFLGIDPGYKKCGIAVVNFQKEIVYKNIIKTLNIFDILLTITEEYEIEEVAVGNGTNYKKIINYLNAIKSIRENQKKKMNIYLIDEKNSTIEARKMFLKKEKSLIKKIINFFKSLFIPLDDLAALVIVSRLIDNYKELNYKKQNLQDIL